MSPPEITWEAMPEHHDFRAADQYLHLVLKPKHADRAAQKLREETKTKPWKAKDILRAAQTPALGADDEGVAAKLAKIKAGKPLSPVLLVERETGPLIIADGYHRTSAAYLLDENNEVPAVEAHV